MFSETDNDNTQEKIRDLLYRLVSVETYYRTRRHDSHNSLEKMGLQIGAGHNVSAMLRSILDETKDGK